MADLTAITTPFGLLDKETQDALRAHGGPYEAFCVHEDDGRPEWLPQDCYGTPFDFDTHPAIAWRVKPQPPKPRECWVVEYSPDDWQIYGEDGDRAIKMADENGGKASLWREVLE